MRALPIALSILCVVAAGLCVVAAGADAQTASPEPAPQAMVETGALVGVTEGPARVFHAIPFAQPPVRDLRWRAPRPPDRWAGVRDATHEGPACEQPAGPEGRPNGGGYIGPVSED